MQSKFSDLLTKRIQNYSTQTVNVNDNERLFSVTLGTFFLTRGLRKVNVLNTLLGGYLIYRGASGHCPVYGQLQRNKYTDKPESVNIQTTLIVNKPKQEVYDFWRKLENLPLFMKHLKSVKEVDEKNLIGKQTFPVI